MKIENKTRATVAVVAGASVVTGGILGILMVTGKLPPFSFLSQDPKQAAFMLILASVGIASVMLAIYGAFKEENITTTVTSPTIEQRTLPQVAK